MMKKMMLMMICCYYYSKVVGTNVSGLKFQSAYLNVYIYIYILCIFLIGHSAIW